MSRAARAAVTAVLLLAVVVGVVVTVALVRDGSDEPTGADDLAGTPVTEASATWGVRESFVDYMARSGTITVADGATRDPDLGWPGASSGSGTFDVDALTGEVRLGGSVTFSMPAHCMNELTFRDPVVVVDSPGAARLLVDTTVDFFGQDTGEGVDCLADPAAALDDTFPRSHVADVTIDVLTATEQPDGSTVVTLTGTPVTLTATGSTYFNRIYAEGTELAPLSLTFTVEG